MFLQVVHLFYQKLNRQSQPQNFLTGTVAVVTHSTIETYLPICWCEVQLGGVKEIIFIVNNGGTVELVEDTV